MWQWRRGHRTRKQLDVVVSQHPQGLDRGHRALVQVDLLLELDVDKRLAAHEPDLGDPADENARDAHVGLLLETRDVFELNGHRLRHLAAETQILDVPDQNPRQSERQQKECSYLRSGTHRASQIVLCIPFSNSPVSGPVARPSTNCRTAGSLLFMNSS